MNKPLFIGIDIGGTKIAAGLISETGSILSRAKIDTPQPADLSALLEALAAVMDQLTAAARASGGTVAGMGVGIPGIVRDGRVLVAPNIALDRCDIAQALAKKFKLPVVAGNDVNLGLLGEKWLGAARNTDDVIGLFPGTGVGGAIILNNTLTEGINGAAAELGHMVMDINGPRCSCGNRGCLEALAGRWAIERDIRSAVKNGAKTVLTRSGKDLTKIKSKRLRQALDDNDALVTRVIRDAARVLGMACVSLRHIFDPEMIVLGGGLIEACGKYILPSVRDAVKHDVFFRTLTPCRIVESQLGDDAIICGAAARIQQHLGVAHLSAKAAYPRVQSISRNSVLIDDKTYTKDIFIRADGKIKKRSKKLIKESSANKNQLSTEEIEKICRKQPQLLIIASTSSSGISLNPQAKAYLKKAGIEYTLLAIPDAVRLYHTSDKRRAMMVHIGGKK